MTRVLAVLLSTLAVAGAAHAQSNPPGAAVPPNTPGIATDRATQAGEARKQNRPAVPAKRTMDDTTRTPEGGAIGTDRAAMRGEQRADTRDQRRPNKPRTTQGGTPK